MGQLRTQKHGQREREKRDFGHQTKHTSKILSWNIYIIFCNLRCDLFLIYTSDLFVKWRELKQDNNDGYLGKQEDPS